jgi:nitrogen regulatory protein P-II 2
MNLSARKLLTIVAESGLENRLITTLNSAGAKGYTVSTAHGQGPRDQRAGDISGGNIRIESVVQSEVLDRIIAALEADYFPHYAVSSWISDVDVIRDERY